MPVIPSRFTPPWFVRNGHLQTLVSAVIPRSFNLETDSERLELEDGDFLDLNWLRKGRDRLAILSHGLEGCSNESYILGMTDALSRAGWDVLAWNFRGCGTEPNRLLRFYHSGETWDLGSVVRHAAANYSRIALVGFSLGGNVTLKYLGESKPHPAIVGAATISVPVNLAASAAVLDQKWGNRLYLRRFIKTLVAKVEAKAGRFPGQMNVNGIRKIRKFKEFDDRFTAPIHRFRDANDYWTRSSSRQYLPAISVPTLLLNALDDPFLTPECFPYEEAEQNPFLHLECPRSGGHLGFIDPACGFRPWHEKRVIEFFEKSIV